jgi:hypothetical protein
MELLTMECLFQKASLDYKLMEKNISYDVSKFNFKVKSYNHETDSIEFKKIISLIRKDEVIGYNLVSKAGDILLKCSGSHQIYDCALKDYFKVKDIESGLALSNSMTPVEFFVIKSNEVYPIVDMEVEDNKNYFTNGLLSHNTGGNALKFYASQRFEIRKIETVDGKDGEDATANRVRVKCVKNKVAPPFRKAEFLIEFGKGISKLDSLINIAVKLNVIDKKGSWYSYKAEKIGQGKDNVMKFLVSNKELQEDIYNQCTTILFSKSGNTVILKSLEQEADEIKEKEVIE